MNSYYNFDQGSTREIPVPLVVLVLAKFKGFIYCLDFHQETNGLLDLIQGYHCCGRGDEIFIWFGILSI